MYCIARTFFNFRQFREGLGNYIYFVMQFTDSFSTLITAMKAFPFNTSWKSCKMIAKEERKCLALLMKLWRPFLEGIQKAEKWNVIARKWHFKRTRQLNQNHHMHWNWLHLCRITFVQKLEGIPICGF